MNSVPRCSRCQTDMEVGYVLDRAHAIAGQPATWIEGEPVRSFWTGTKLDGKEQLQIHTFRCPKCGYLESYAP